MNEKLFTISKDGTIYKNYKTAPVNHSQITNETKVLLERMVRKNVLEPEDEWKHIFRENDIDPNEYYGKNDLKSWIDYLINQGVIQDPEDIDQTLAGLRLILGDKTKYDYSDEKGDLVIKPAGDIKISPSQHRKIMITYLQSLADKTPVYVDKKGIREHIGGVSQSTLDKLMVEGLPYVKIGGTRRVGFSKPAVNKWLKENS